MAKSITGLFGYEIADKKARSQLNNIANELENIGSPTQEQIDSAVTSYLIKNPITGGLTTTAKNLLVTILRNAMYTTNQSANITALESALASSSSDGDTPTVTNYTIKNTLTNCANSNVNTSVAENTSYIATITANTGYNLDTVTITMGGIDITSSSYDNGTINIANVTGNIVITANAIVIIENTLKEFALSPYYNWVNGTNSATGYSAFEVPEFAVNIVSFPTSSSEMPDMECNTLEVVTDSVKRASAKELITGICTTTNYLCLKILSNKLETNDAHGFKTYLESNIINVKLKVLDGVKSFEIPTTNWSKVITHEGSNVYHFEHDIDAEIYEDISNASNRITNIGYLGDYTVNLNNSKLIMSIPDYKNNNFSIDDVATYYAKYKLTPCIYYV